MEILISVIGGILALFIYRRVSQSNVENGQKKLENRVKEIEKKKSELRKKEESISKRESEKVKEIEDEQNKNVTGDDLVDFFRNRKGK